MLKKFRPDKVIFSLDSDVLFALSYISMIKKNPELKSEKEESSQDILNNPKKRVIAEKLYEFFDNGELEFFVSPPVYIEARNAKYVTDFIKEHCYMPRVIYNNKGKEELEGIKEVQDLAQKYIKPRYYIDNEGEKRPTYPAMIHKPNVSNFNLYEPTSDVYVMAWSTVYGYELLTNNEDHFISYGKIVIDKKTGEKSKDFYRRKAIREINEKEGYIVSIKENTKITPAPHTLLEYEHIVNFNTLKIHTRSLGELDTATETIEFLENTMFRFQDILYNKDDTEIDYDETIEL